MRLHLFNPEHDIALSVHRPHFTAPFAGRQLRHDLGFLPAFWADAEDVILVDNLEEAQTAWAQWGRWMNGRLVEWKDRRIRHLAPELEEVSPWGWDMTVRTSLAEVGVSAALLPDDEGLTKIRALSHREWAARHVLAPLREWHPTVGEAYTVRDLGELVALSARHGNLMVKAPWSSSGRGVRLLSEHDVDKTGVTEPNLAGWMASVIRKQKAIMVEPYYDRVMDFGMEYVSDGCGGISYEGLSVFDTRQGAYLGNVIEREEYKRALIGTSVDIEWLDILRDETMRLMGQALAGVYAGPFGVDMMIVRTAEGLAVHPCVELNLRRTMGHVAIALGRHEALQGKTMRITFDGHYRLVLQ